MNSDDDLRISRLESQVSYLLAHLGIDPATAARAWADGGSAASGSLPGDFFGQMPRPGIPGGPMPAGVVPPQVRDALQMGKLIEAIKIYRTLTGASLKEAKLAVERMARDMGIIL